MSSAPPVHSALTMNPGRVWRQTVRAQIVRRRIAMSIVIFATLIALDMFVFRVLPRDVLNWTDPFVLCGLSLVGLGLFVRSWSAGVLHKQQRLTTTGPYSLVRNPLYFGSFLMMFGFGLLIDDYWSAPIILGPVALIYLVQIRHEERALAEIFGDDWQAYVATTPRFLPRLARPTGNGWSIEQWLKNREWQAIAASGLSLVALQAWLLLLG